MAANTQVREQNMARIFRLLRTGEAMTRQEIAAALSLSMPTTLQNVSELAAAGLLEECGAVESTGGRRARKFRLRREAGCALGIDIALQHTELVLTDLLGGVLAAKNVPLIFRDETDWYLLLQDALTTFLQDQHIPVQAILGAGVSFPGIIDAAGSQIARSHIFGLSHVALDRFRHILPFPAVFANDANCAGFSEKTAGHSSFVYLSLNQSVGGAILLNQKLWLGNSCQAGEIGHMILIPGGKACYCGKQGCADAYLSSNVLIGTGGTLEDFFGRLRAGGAAEQAVWDIYLEHLAILLTNLRMLTNLDLVVGGRVGAYIAPFVPDLNRKAAQYDHFARDVDYIFPCAQREHACAVGAAALALEQYGSRVLDRVERTTP